LVNQFHSSNINKILKDGNPLLKKNTGSVVGTQISLNQTSTNQKNLFSENIWQK